MPGIEVELPYGVGVLRGRLGAARLLGTLDVKDAPGIEQPAQVLQNALAAPIGHARAFVDSLKPGQTVCVIVSDSFRYTGVELLLPELLGVMDGAGIRDEDISVLFATGSHRGPTESEAEKILGAKVYAWFKDRAYTHDPADTAGHVLLGATRRGTPVEINRRAVECDHLIVTGTVVYHYFGGFGGGRKSILPGVASLRSIAHNHSLNLHPTENRRDPDVRIGRLAGNPVAEDMAEGAALCPVSLSIHTVLNRRGEIAGLFAGELAAAHAAACQYAASLYGVSIKEKADLVIASAGNAKNFVQSHKAMFNAFSVMRPGGRLILAAPAPEGLGGERFRTWLGLKEVDAVFRELRRQAEINGQTALSVLEKGPSTLLLTEMTDAEVALTGARRADTLQEALDLAVAELGAAGQGVPSVYLMPSAGFTVVAE